MVRKTSKPNTVAQVRKGKVYQYYRKNGKYTRLPDDPDSLEYDRAYWAIRSGRQSTRTVRTTYENLIQSYYKSSQYERLAKSTKVTYRRILEQIRIANGSKDFTKLSRRNVIEARDSHSETPRKANYYVQLLSILSKHAIDLEWITANPARGVELFKPSREFEPWPQWAMDAFEKYCKENDLSLILTAFYLGTGTGQRPGDLTRMEWAHFNEGYMYVLQEKTKIRLEVFCPDHLRKHLGDMPKSGRYILAKNLTQPVTYNSLEKQVRKVRAAIGAEKYTMHGWRYTAAVALAEAGCSDSEIQSVTGHKTLAMVQKYRGKANQRKLSMQAQKRRK